MLSSELEARLNDVIARLHAGYDKVPPADGRSRSVSTEVNTTVDDRDGSLSLVGSPYDGFRILQRTPVRLHYVFHMRRILAPVLSPILRKVISRFRLPCACGPLPLPSTHQIVMNCC